MSRIELIGSIDHQTHYKASDIAELLDSEKESLGIGSEFVGRPATRIYSNEHYVVKIRAEMDLSADKAFLWASNELKKEREITVHHPYKTWFVFDDLDAEQVLVGSICPRLLPLNVLFKAVPETLEARTRYLNILQAVFTMYFELAKGTGHKLDEGLSNFAIDHQDKVYYLDDEYYSWDNFISFAVMLGVFIRTFDWLDDAFIQLLSDALIELLDRIFQDPHCRVIIASQLQSLFMSSGEKQQLLTIMTQSVAKTPAQPKAKNGSVSDNRQIKNNTRYLAIMADIHANEAALECVLQFYKEHKIRQGIVLGDIVGYGPDPKVCIDKLMESPFEIIKGNHDHAVAVANTDKGFSANAKVAIDWTIEQLDQEYREWLQYLPAYVQNKDWFAVHGAPMDPAFFYGYVYLMTAEDNLSYMQEKNMSLCFHGHSHMPGIFAREKQHVQYISEQKSALSQYRQALVCPGSVGQPRNGYPHAQCAIYDTELQTVEWFTLSYPVDAVVQRMKQHNLPEQLWQRLLIGK